MADRHFPEIGIDESLVEYVSAVIDFWCLNVLQVCPEKKSENWWAEY